jgi:Uncharacterized conserved protein
MQKMPFDPLLLPIQKDFIDLNEIISLFGEAERKLGEFNEKVASEKVYSNHALRHLAKMESVYSTKIEGTQTTINAVYEAEADIKEKRNSVDTEEVLRYSKALYVGASEIKTEPITCKLIKSLHEILLSGKEVRKNTNFQAGEFRSMQNKVGDHLPPAAVRVDDLMGNLENYINAATDKYNDGLPSLIKIAIIHAQFETIHPFPDGNGRVGRILIPLYLYKEGVIKSPYFLISQELEKNKIKYYNFLQGTRKKNKEGFTDWIVFFLEATVNQCQKDIDFINNLQALYESTHDRIIKIKNSINSEKILNVIFENPIFTVSKMSELTNIPKTTLYPYLKSLEEQHVIFSDQKQRNRGYHFIELLDLLRS